jgi:hypothetical protein
MLWLGGTQITAAGLKDLKQALPKTVIGGLDWPARAGR